MTQDIAPRPVSAYARLYPSALSAGGWYLLAPDWPLEQQPVFSAPPPHLQPVLHELLQGTPDTMASRRLNMSIRTFSRRVAELLDYLGVETRFQAGAEAMLRGWIPPRGPEVAGSGAARLAADHRNDPTTGPERRPPPQAR